MKRKNNLLVKLSVWMIREIWQRRFGIRYKKKKGIICRFYPDCSNYTIQALEEYGFIEGWKKGYSRFKRCTDENTEICVDYP